MNKMTLILMGRSILDRRFSLSLIVLALAAAIALYISVQNIQRMTRASFENSVANVDLVVSARSSDIQILLNSVFGIGQPTGLVSAESVKDIADLPQTAWHVPVSLGDSHRGFRVIGATNEMFTRVLKDSNGDAAFDDVLDTIVGADVATALDYAEGDAIVLQHGVGDYGAAHDDLPFRIHKVLARSGTPFDRAVFIPLEASEAIHRGWRGGQKLMSMTPEQVAKTTPAPRREEPHDEHHEGHHDEHHEGHHDEHHEGHHSENHDEHHDEHHEGHEHGHGPDGIDAVFIGLKEKRTVVQMQRLISEFETEALTAVIPGVALARIWQIIGFADRGFMAINLLIVGLVLLSMVAMTVLSADNRRREMAIFRALGASPRVLVGLMIGEALLLSLAAVVLGIAFAIGLSAIAHEAMAARFGLTAEAAFYFSDIWVAFYLVPAALIANLVPAMRLYRNSINDGIMVRR